MVLPSPNHKYVAVSYTSDQFVHILSAEAKQMVACIDARLVPGLEGGLIHTGAWYGDDHFVMVDMTGSLYGVQGGALHKFFINFTRIEERGSCRCTNNGADDGLTHEASLAIGPSAVGRGTVGTKPIAIGTNPIGAYRSLYFVTDAKGPAPSLMSPATWPSWPTFLWRRLAHARAAGCGRSTTRKTRRHARGTSSSARLCEQSLFTAPRCE